MNIDQPVMWWRPASPTCGGSVVARTMHYYASGVQGRINESHWFIWNFHAAGEAFDIYFTNAASGFQYPANGFYSTNMDGTFVQDGQLYSYIPAAIVSRGRRDYDPANVPTLFSPH